MRINWNIVITSTLVLCAVVTTSLVVRREWLEWSSDDEAPIATLVDDWEAAIPKGATLGSADARVKLIEFVDFQCRFCASFHEDLKALHAQYPRDIAVTFLHFPLSGHDQAEPAARAAECAARQGRLDGMHDHLFKNQQNFGKTPWIEFARAAGVADLPAFESCLQDRATGERILAHKELGQSEFDIKGTPTLIINGWKLTQTPDRAALDDMVRAVLNGEAPVKQDPWWSIF